MKQVNLKPCPRCGRDVYFKSGSIVCYCGLSFRPRVTKGFDSHVEEWNNKRS